jgi:hypothetical protein
MSLRVQGAHDASIHTDSGLAEIDYTLAMIQIRVKNFRDGGSRYDGIRAEIDFEE